MVAVTEIILVADLKMCQLFQPLGKVQSSFGCSVLQLLDKNLNVLVKRQQ